MKTAFILGLCLALIIAKIVAEDSECPPDERGGGR